MSKLNWFRVTLGTLATVAGVAIHLRYPEAQLRDAVHYFFGALMGFFILFLLIKEQSNATD